MIRDCMEVLVHLPGDVARALGLTWHPVRRLRHHWHHRLHPWHHWRHRARTAHVHGGGVLVHKVVCIMRPGAIASMLASLAGPAQPAIAPSPPPVAHLPSPPPLGYENAGLLPSAMPFGARPDVTSGIVPTGALADAPLAQPSIQSVTPVSLTSGGPGDTTPVPAPGSATLLPALGLLALLSSRRRARA